MENKDQERIKAEAAATKQQKAKFSHEEYELEGHEEGYIAGATAENAKAQVLVDAIEAFILWQGSTLENWPVMKQAHEALQQWKGKEVENGK